MKVFAVPAHAPSLVWMLTRLVGLSLDIENGLTCTSALAVLLQYTRRGYTSLGDMYIQEDINLY